MNNWKRGIDYPEFMTEEGLKTLERQHLQDGETPAEMYERIINTLSDRLFLMLKKTKLSRNEIKQIVKYVKQKWKEYLWKGWLSPSTPILANVGTNRGYGISCFIEQVDDTLDSIFLKIYEMAMLGKMGGGIGITFDKIRGRGEKISSGGFSEGTIPFIKCYDSAIVATSQGSVRRGAASINIPIRHKDINEFLNIRLPEGDVNRQCLNINHCVTIDDYFMNNLLKGDQESRNLWVKILTTRMKTGQPYIMYYNNAHSQRPDDMKKRNLKINGTNICVSGDTIIELKVPIKDRKKFENINVKICELETISKNIKEIYVKSYNTETNEIEWCKLLNFGKTAENAEVILIEDLENGFSLKCTPNHKILTQRGYIEAKELKEDDKLVI